MIGPSAIGSENGTPTSITSAPASSRPRSSSRLEAGSGNPAVMYVTRARRPPARSLAKRSAIRSDESDEVVTDADAIPFGILRLDDRPAKTPVRCPLREVDQDPG